MKKHTVSEDKEIVLDGKKFLLEKGDKITLNENIDHASAKDRGFGLDDFDLGPKFEIGEYLLENDMTVRAIKVLNANGINTMEQLKNLTFDDLLRMRNMGRYAATKIYELVHNEVPDQEFLREGKSLSSKPITDHTVSEDKEIVLDGKKYLLEKGDTIVLETMGTGAVSGQSSIEEVEGGKDFPDIKISVHEPEEDLFWNMIKVSERIADFYKSKGRDVSVHDAEETFIGEFGQEAYDKFKLDVLGQEKVDKEKQIYLQLDNEFDQYQGEDRNILIADIFDKFDMDADAHSDPAAANLWARMKDMSSEELQQFHDQVMSGELSYSDFYHL